MNKVFIKQRYLVYSTWEHNLLRLYLISFVILFFFLYIKTAFSWLLPVSFFMFALVSYVLFALSATISFSSEGISLHYLFLKKRTLRWEDIQCCGAFSLVTFGSHKENQFIYFSSSPVSYTKLVNAMTLPQQTDSFLFLTNQPGLFESLKQYLSRSKMKNIPIDDKHPQSQMKNRSLSVFFVLLWIVLILSVVLLLYTKDYMWIIPAIISIVFILKIKRRS